ncbi:MAG: enoyl-CoA hydratase-related protein [Ilumatobacteraceae bacterium]
MPDPVVRCSVAEAVATITLDSPVNRNALSSALVADLHTALDRAETDDVRVIVLTNTGSTFCAGADLRERLAGPVDSSPVVRAFRRLMESRRPTIAAVKGVVRAGGIGLMASCDLVVVERRANFAFTEVRIGAAPAMIAVPLLRRCSAAQLTAAFLTGEVFDAELARMIGLVSHVADGADGADGVDGVVATLCRGLMEGAPGALAATKEVLRTVPGEPVSSAFSRMQELSERLFTGTEAREGMQSFLDKRRPSWAPPP